MGKPLSLNGIKMHVVSTAEGGKVNSETIFDFSQDGSVVAARYSGGKIKLGYLVGMLNPTGSLEFRYTQVDNDGRLDGGYSNCEISRMADGRVRLLEHFKWESCEGNGINVFEEIEIKQ